MVTFGISFLFLVGFYIKIQTFNTLTQLKYGPLAKKGEAGSPFNPGYRQHGIYRRIQRPVDYCSLALQPIESVQVYQNQCLQFSSQMPGKPIKCKNWDRPCMFILQGGLCRTFCVALRRFFPLSTPLPSLLNIAGCHIHQMETYNLDSVEF